MGTFRSKVFITAILSLSLSACQSLVGAKIGMSEQAWLATTLIGDLVYMEGSVKAYQSGGIYYYFRDGILVKVDRGRIPAQVIIMDVTVR